MTYHADKVEWSLTSLQTYIAHQFHNGTFYLDFEEDGYDWGQQNYTSTEVNGTHAKIFSVKLANDIADTTMAAAYTLATRIYK